MAKQSKSNQKWLWIFVPINAAIGGFSTLLPLYIIEIGGTVIDVGNIVSAYSLTLIPSSILWGIAVDRKEERRPFVTYGYLGITVLFVAGFFLTDCDPPESPAASGKASRPARNRRALRTAPRPKP